MYREAWSRAKLIFCQSYRFCLFFFAVRRRRCKNSLLLSSRNFAAMITWRHTSPLYSNLFVKLSELSGVNWWIKIISACSVKVWLEKFWVTIAHIRYIKILTWLRGFLVIFLYLVWLPCPNLFCELRDNGVVKNLQFCPQHLGVCKNFNISSVTY